MLTRKVGRLVGLWRYPVKSMAAEPLETAEVGWHGLAGDRRWAFVRPDVASSGFPWLTIRQRADMSQFRPRFTDPERSDTSPTVVHTPSGEELDVVDPELAEALAPGARVIRQSRGIFDTFPLSLLTTRSVDGLAAVVGEPLDALRFRPNLLVEADGDTPFPEDAWVGATLQIGTLRLRVDARDQRCAVVNVEPSSGQHTPGVLRAIAQVRESRFGVYGTTVQPGRVAVGDAIHVVSA